MIFPFNWTQLLVAVVSARNLIMKNGKKEWSEKMGIPFTTKQPPQDSKRD
jgi:hypothetical protein